LKYRPDIDGLRAFAIIPVILFHMGFNWISGGFVGVDVFFVISGYLITQTIIRDHDTNAFTFLKFWSRRIKRIFPALAVMVLVVSLVSRFVFFGEEINEFGFYGISSIFSFSNLAIWKLAGNYWGVDANRSPFLHTWSLSVEEQFYLIYPFVLIFLIRFGRKIILTAFVVFIFISFCTYFYGSSQFPTAAFYFLPTRAWELLGGAFLAVLGWRHEFKFHRVASGFFSLLGFILMIASYFIISETNTSGYSLFLPVFGASLLIFFMNPAADFIFYLLSNQVFVFIGKISYSLYLWHWPILIFVRQLDADQSIDTPFWITVLLILAFSLLSYYFVEQRMRKNPKALYPLLLILILSTSSTFSMYFKKISYDTSIYSQTKWNGDLYNVNPKDTLAVIRNRMKGITLAQRNQDFRKAYLNGGIIKKYGNETPKILVIGDSHALMWSNTLNNIAMDLKTTISFYAVDGVSPFFSIPPKAMPGGSFFTTAEKYQFDQKILFYIQKWKPKLTIISARWSHHHDLTEIKDLIEFIGKNGSKILLIEQPPELFFGDRNALEYLTYLRFSPKIGQNQYIKSSEDPNYDLGRQMIRDISKKYDYCDYVPTADVFYKQQNQSWILDGKTALYIDDDHLSEAGANKAEGRLYEKIASIIGR
jgi:peptidoglycan/LPS O-acetylase OafA/YrhL